MRMRQIGSLAICAVALGGLLSVSAFALESGVYTGKMITSYYNPDTGEVDDGGTANAALGEGMCRSATDENCLVEVEGNDVWITVRLLLQSNCSNVALYTRDDYNSYSQVAYSVTSEDAANDSIDYRIKVAEVGQKLKSTMYVSPMGRDVLWYLYVDTNSLQPGSGDFVVSIENSQPEEETDVSAAASQTVEEPVVPQMESPTSVDSAQAQPQATSPAPVAAAQAQPQTTSPAPATTAQAQPQTTAPAPTASTQAQPQTTSPAPTASTQTQPQTSAPAPATATQAQPQTTAPAPATSAQTQPQTSASTSAASSTQTAATTASTASAGTETTVSDSVQTDTSSVTSDTGETGETAGTEEDSAAEETAENADETTAETNDVTAEAPEELSAPASSAEDVFAELEESTSSNSSQAAAVVIVVIAAAGGGWYACQKHKKGKGRKA